MNKLFFTLLFLAIAAYGQMQERVAIIQTLDNNDSLGINDLAYLTDKLRETAVNVLPKEQYGVMTTESIIAFLGSQEKARKACNESSCLAELGRKVSADYVAQGRIGRFVKDLTIKVELYSVKSGNLIGSFVGDSKDIYGLRDIINEKAPDLFKKMPNTSNVKKTAPPPEAPTPPPTPVASKPEYTPPPKPQYTPPVEPKVPIVEKNEESDYRSIRVKGLIEEGVKKNKEKIQKESSYINFYERGVLYKENENKTVAGWVTLNLLPGFGLGSYIQGDIAFGVVQSTLGVLFVVSWNLGVKYDEKYAYKEKYEGKYKEAKKYRSISDLFLNISYVSISTSYLTGIIRPFYYISGYNKMLREALNIDENISLSIDPLIIPRDGTPAVGLAFNVRY